MMSLGTGALKVSGGPNAISREEVSAMIRKKANIDPRLSARIRTDLQEG